MSKIISTMNRKVLSILTLSLTYWAFAQKTDSLAGKIKSIEEVVVTGQYNAQSVNKSVYKVEVINEAQIKNMAATNVAEVLNQSLNMQITPDSKSGNSTANILGLDGVCLQKKVYFFLESVFCFKYRI